VLARQGGNNENYITERKENMIEVKVNSGNVKIKRVQGNSVGIMAELCCLVKAVCMSFCEDEKDSEEMTRAMVSAIADALVQHEDLLQGRKLEDNENADF